jgi:single-strand DNA-binding protein
MALSLKTSEKMAFSLNRGQIIGNVTRDAEVRQIPSGQTVASFSVATNRRWKDASGEWQDKADFHNVVAWGKLAEICSQYVKKGRKIYVEGRMQTSEWEGDDGQKRYRSEIVAENVILLDRAGAPTGEEGGTFEREANTAAVKPAAGEQAGGQPASQPVELKKEEVAIDDLPF